jgi:hypothetical protein
LRQCRRGHSKNVLTKQFCGGITALAQRRKRRKRNSLEHF